MPASLPLPRPRSVRSAAGPVAGPGRPRPGSLRAVAAAVLVVAATAAGVAAPGPAGAQEGPTAPVADPAPPVTGPAPAPPPTEVPVEVEAATIDRLVAEVVARREAQIASAVQAVQAAEQALAQAASRLAPLQAAADRATTEERTAAREVESWRRRVALFAADAYMRAGTDRDEAVTQLAGSGSSAAEAGHDATRTSVYAGNAVRAARRELDAAVAGLAGAREREQRALDALAVGEADVDAQIAVGDSARTVEATLRAAPLAAPVVAPSGSSGAGRSGPTLLGGSVLGAEELAAFVRDRGRAHPSVDVEALAAAFIEEGAAEGVRADLAWAQSIVETGSFGFAGSMVDPGDHNYAGIGACDSCSTGFTYDTPQLGVRAQMQLLRTYADPVVTGATLARPAVGKLPELVGVRGCCTTWMALSGVWATGPQYGNKILAVYDQMLRFAVARRAGGQVGAGASTPSVTPSVVPPG